jgi:DNA repair exonuclease SbcCD ATPase subunit
MRIIHLHSENVKRIKAIDITPESDIIVLSGKNGEGKTSVLDSIWLALQYRAASKGTPTPLRAGEDKGFVTIDLDDYIVTRRFTEKSTTLEVRTPDGSKITSPQKLLDGLIGDLSFDPWEFSRKNEKEQRQMIGDVLFAITDGEVDLAAFEIRQKEIAEKRTEANREKKRLETLLTNMRPPTAQEPTEEKSAEQLTSQIAAATKQRAELDRSVAHIQELQIRILKLEEELKQTREQLKAAEDHVASIPSVPDIDAMTAQLEELEKYNRRAREVQEYKKTRSALDDVVAEVQGYNDKLELISIEKDEALEDSPLPVTGLRVTPDGIMVLNEDDELVPFCQASAAQRLRYSLGIAMAANPTLRVIRIADGSLLDDESMDIVKQMAQDKDFQVWVEYASRNEQDRIGVYIEDGTASS